MFTKEFRKLTIAAFVAFVAFFMGGLSQLAAFSVDVKNIYYSDTAPRTIGYDFSAGSPPINNTITIPDNFVPQRPAAETGLSYTFGPYPTGPGETNDIQVALDPTGSRAILTSAAHGGCIINTVSASTTTPGLPDLRTATNTWSYSVRFQNFSGMTDPAKGYHVQIGFGSPVPGPHPELTVAWPPSSGARNLVLEAGIYDDSVQRKVWSSPPLNVSGFTPANISLTLRLRSSVLATGANIVFDYSIDNGQTWALIGTYNLPAPVPTPFPYLGFPAKFPYVALSTESGEGGYDPFQVYSYHNKDGYYYGVFIDDPGQQLYQDPVTVESTDLALAPTALVFSYGQWRLPQAAAPTNFLGVDKPTTFPSFVFKATKKLGGMDTQSRAITGYVEQFAQVTSPPPSVTTPPTFTWTWPAGAPAPQWYGVSVFDVTANMTPVMNVFDLPGTTTSVPYSGQTLVPGRVYHYTITAGIGPNTSFSEGDFAFAGGSGGGVTISYSGNVVANNQSAYGAVVEMEGSSPLISTTTGTDGNFTLNGLPFNTPFSIKITKPPTQQTDPVYVPLYSRVLQSTNNFSAHASYWLFTPNDLTTWGVVPGRGVIRGVVVDSVNLDGFIGGAVVTYTSQMGHTDYIVKYRDGQGNPVDGTGTRANGGFFILNVMEGDVVTINASQPNYTFPQPIVFKTHGGAVSTGRIHGNLLPGKVLLSGYVKDKNGNGVSGATIERVGAQPSNSTSSLNDGLYNLIVPAGTTPIYLKFSKTSFAPTYTPEFAFTTDHVTIGDDTLFTSAEYISIWNATAGKGVIRGRVKDLSGNPLGGATVTAQSQLHPATPYAVCYDNACTAALTSTDSTTGGYVIKNVDPGDTVTVTAQKTGWTFVTRIFHTYADSLHEGGIKGEVSALPVNNLLQNGRFDTDMAGWIVNPALGQWNPRMADGTIALHLPQSPQSDFIGTIVCQNVNITNIAGKNINLFMSLTSNSSWSSGKTIAVYLHYVDNSNVVQKVKIFNPNNADIGLNTTFISLYTFPATARKLIRFEIAKEDYGDFFADNISLAADGVTQVPLPTITGLSTSSGAYGSQLTITGNNFGTAVGKVFIDGSQAGIQVNNWSETAITITVQAPAESGRISVEAGFVASNVAGFFNITSPYAHFDAVTKRVRVVKGEVAEFTFKMEFFNDFVSAGGFTFSVDNSTINALSTFTPTPLMSPGGMLLKINTATLTPGLYAVNVKAVEAGMLPRLAPIELEVITVSDIVFIENAQPITSKSVSQQGQIWIYAEPRGASGAPIYGSSPLGLIEMRSNHPSLGVYKRTFGYDIYALSNGTATLTARTPDGLSRDLTVNMSLPTPPPVTLSLNPAEVSNLRTDPITFSASGTAPLGWIGYDYGEMLDFQTDFNDPNVVQRSQDQLSATASFRLTKTPVPLGTVLFDAQSGSSKAVAPLTIVNDPTMAAVRVSVKSLDGGSTMFAAENFNLEFYGDGAQPVFKRNGFTMHGGGAGGILVGGITPGKYKIKFVPGTPENPDPNFLPQWWPNADDKAQAQPVTFTAGQTVDNIVFFPKAHPMIFFAGSVKDALVNFPNTPISGATATAELIPNDPRVYVPSVQTDINGDFTLNGIPQGTNFAIKITKSGFLSVYSATFNWGMGITALLPFGMFPQTQFTAWGNDMTKGIILGRVTQANNPAGYLAGATITAVNSQTRAVYQVSYANAADTATAADGFFYVKNVPDGVSVELSASLPGWNFIFPVSWVTVHAGAVSEQSFFAVKPPVSYMGQVTDKDGMPIARAKVEVIGSTAVNPVTTDPGGNFTLQGIPVGENFHLKISKEDFLPTYSSNQQVQGTVTATNRPFILHTAVMVSKWGVTPDKGVIAGRVFDMQDPMRSDIAGAVVTAIGTSKTYPVTYQDDAGVFGGQSTYGNGKYFVLNVDDGDTVTVTAQKAGWSFAARNFQTHAGGVSQGGIPGTRQLLLGKWGRVALGQTDSGWFTESMVITFNDDGTSATSDVYRNEQGVVSHKTDTFNYTLAANPDGSYNMQIFEPGQPPNPPMRLVLSEDGNVALIDEPTMQKRIFQVLVKINPAKTYANADLSGEYFGLDYGHSSPPSPPPNNMAVSNITTFSAATGTFTSVARANVDGALVTDDQSATPHPYVVNSDGSVSLREGKLMGSVAGNSQLALASGPFVSGANPWTVHLLMKKAERAYSASDLAGTWAYASFGDIGGTTFRSEFGGFTCNANGKCDFNFKVVGSDGSVSFIPSSYTFNVAQDGSFGSAPGSTVPFGKIGNDGKTILLNRSFDNLQDRSIHIAIKVQNIQNVAGAKYPVWAGTHHDGVGYFGDFVVDDPGHLLTSVTLTGSGITGAKNLTYRPDAGAWWTVPQLPLTGPPTGAGLNYTLTLTDSAQNITTVQKTLSGGVANFATNLSPTGTQRGPFNFSFTGITGGEGYLVHLFDAANNNVVWISERFPAPAATNTISIPYTGPALQPGDYYYLVHSWIGENSSVVKGQFTVPQPFARGDVNHSGNLDLADVILSLQAAMGPAMGSVSAPVFIDTDVNNDGMIGVPEAIYVTQVLAGLRTASASPMEEAKNGAIATLALFKARWNSITHTMTDTELNSNFLPLYHPAYLNDGLDRDYAVLHEHPPKDFVIDSFTTGSVFFDVAKKVITIEDEYTGRMIVNGVPGVLQNGILTEIFSFDPASGYWLFYGNQRLGDMTVWPGTSRTVASNGGVSDQTILHFHLKAPQKQDHTPTVNQVAVSGPGLNGAMVFTKRGQEGDNGITYDYFTQYSGSQDVDIATTPMVGDEYTFTVTKADNTTVVYNQTIKNVRLGAPFLTSPKGHALSDARIGSQLNLSWTLPDPGISFDDVYLSGNVCWANGCGIPVDGVVTSPTSGAITLPVPTQGSATSASVEVIVHYLGEVFMRCRYEFK